MAVTDRSHRLLSWLARVAESVQRRARMPTLWLPCRRLQVKTGLPGIADCHRLVSGTSAARKIRGGKGGRSSSRQ
jgi:hypothetical protein